MFILMLKSRLLITKLLSDFTSWYLLKNKILFLSLSYIYPLT